MHPSSDQIEDVLQTWIKRGCDAVIEHAASFDELKEECTFSAGALFGGLCTMGLDETAARAVVARYYTAIEAFFNEHWREARAEKRVVN
jgi:hypothetical protein